MTKNALFGFLWAVILKDSQHMGNQPPQISQKAKFHTKTKILHLEEKQPFGCVLGSSFKNLLSYLK